MACHPTDSSIDLAAARHLTLDNARGTLVRVTRGTVWITQEHSFADIILHAGDAWMVEKNGRTVIQAHDDARLCLPRPRPSWWRALQRQAVQRRRAAHAFMRRAAREWASLSPKRALPHY